MQHNKRFLLDASAWVLALSPLTANAQNAQSGAEISTQIQAQRLSDALRQFAEVSDLQLVYDTKITDGKASLGVSGTMSSRAALAALLAGSGLNFQFSGDRTVTIPASASGGEIPPEDGVRGTRKRKVTTDSNHRLGVAANWLDGDFAADVPNHKWAGDITLYLDGGRLALPCRHSRPA